MPFDPLVTAVIETSLNTFVNDDPALVRRLSRLKGQIIQVNLKELNKTLTFVLANKSMCCLTTKGSLIATYL